MRGPACGRGLRGGLESRGAGLPLRAQGRTGLLVAGGDRRRRTVALLPTEPAGKIATRTAGTIEFGATLAWRNPEDVPRKPLLPGLRGGARCSITETEGPEASTRCLAGEIRAMGATELGSTLEVVLRTLTAVAALTEAVLEVGAVRTVAPRVSSASALEELARDIWAAGFGVRFGPLWTPAPAADVCVGVGGGGGLHEFLRSHPAWSIG